MLRRLPDAARRLVRAGLLLTPPGPSPFPATTPSLHEDTETPMTDTTPTVLFICVHNAGRSQMAAGYLRELGGDRVRVLSGGSEPGDALNPVAVAAMDEDGIDISGQVPSILETEQVRESDV